MTDLTRASFVISKFVTSIQYIGLIVGGHNVDLFAHRVVLVLRVV